MTKKPLVPLAAAWLLVPIVAASNLTPIDFSELSTRAPSSLRLERTLDSESDWGSLQFVGNASQGAVAGPRHTGDRSFHSLGIWNPQGVHFFEIGDAQVRTKLLAHGDEPVLVGSVFRAAAPGLPAGQVEFSVARQENDYEPQAFLSVPETGPLNWDADIDPEGRVHLVYHVSVGPTAAPLRYGFLDAGNWNEEIVDVTTMGYGVPVLLLIPTDAWIVLQDSGTFTLYRKGTEGWSGQPILTQITNAFDLLLDSDGLLLLVYLVTGGLCEGMGLFVAPQAQAWKPTKLVSPGCAPEDQAPKTVLVERSLRVIQDSTGNTFAAVASDEISESANRTYVVVRIRNQTDVTGILPKVDQLSLTGDDGPILLVHRGRNLFVARIGAESPTPSPTIEEGSSSVPYPVWGLAAIVMVIWAVRLKKTWN